VEQLLQLLEKQGGSDYSLLFRQVAALHKGDKKVKAVSKPNYTVRNKADLSRRQCGQQSLAAKKRQVTWEKPALRKVK